MEIKSKKSENIGLQMMSGYRQDVVNYWLKEMKDYDELITRQVRSQFSAKSVILFQSVSSVALPLVIGIILFTVIFVTAAVFCCRERQRSQETTPLLS